MSGGPIHIGISDESPAARIRPEARAFASRHSGGDMSSIFKMTNQESDQFSFESLQIQEPTNPLWMVPLSYCVRICNVCIDVYVAMVWDFLFYMETCL